MMTVVERWYRTRTTSFKDWSPERVATLKADTGLSVSLLVRTAEVGAVDLSQIEVGALVDQLIEVGPRLDAHGPRTGSDAQVAGPCGTLPDEEWGSRLSQALTEATGDLIVMIDARYCAVRDVQVRALVGQLMANDDVKLVKAFSTDRPESNLREDPVTELVVRPLLSLHWPELTGLVDPVSGSWAARSELLDEIPIPAGNGCALSLLIDCYHYYGLSAVAQVGLDVQHSASWNESDLTLVATELYAAANRRRDVSAFDRIEPTARELINFAWSPASIRRRRLHTVELAPLSARQANRTG